MNDDGATAAGTEHATSSDGADTAAHTTRGTTSSAAQGVDGADTPNSNSGLRSVLATDFDVWQALGGVRGLVETGAPGLIFVAVYVVTGELIPRNIIFGSACRRGRHDKNTNCKNKC